MNNVEQQKFNAEQLIAQLESCSPLQASKLLINAELFDQQSSLHVLETIYQEFDSKKGVTTSLTEPLFLNICDGLVGIEKLGLKRKGITASRLVNEIKSFSYDDISQTQKDTRLEKEKLDANTQSNIDNKGRFDREDIEDKTALKNYKGNAYGNNRQIRSEIEVNDQGQQKNLYRQNDQRNQLRKTQGKKITGTSSNTDHNIPLKKIFDEFGQSKALSKNDLKKVANQETNFNEISEQLNKSKGAKSWTQFTQQVNSERADLIAKKTNGTISKQEEMKLNALPNEKTLNNALTAEKLARKSIESDANGIVLKKVTSDTALQHEALNNALQSGKEELSQKGLAELVLLIIKPIAFEFKDAIENGLESGTGKNSLFSAIRYRLARALKYVTKNISAIGFDVLKDALLNFCKHIINALVDMFVGMLKKGLKIVIEGFDAIIQSFKILFSDSSPSQKAEAITKLLATTVVTYVSYAFQNSILAFAKTLPMGEVLSDVAMILFTGIASTIVVWLIDKADLFSNKIEQRTNRVKEVFKLRIEQIKENTDAFEATSIKQLAENRLKQRKLSETIDEAIKTGKNVNQSVYDMADFMKIELKVKSTDDFLSLLEQQNSLVI